MSLADAFAAAPAREKKAELVTGDPEFKAQEKEIKVHWLNQARRPRPTWLIVHRPFAREGMDYQS